MAGKSNRLTVRQVQAIAKAGRYADGGNLYLQVTPSGAKSWLFIYRFAGRQREMGLGSAGRGAVPLANARDRAADAKRMLRAGVDPLKQKKAAQAAGAAESFTFGSFADEYVKTMKPGWKNGKHAEQWAMTLGPAYCKDIRGKHIGSVEVGDVLAVLQPVWMSVPETARRLRMRLERVLDAAKAKGLRSGENPARWRGHLDQLLPKQPTSKVHHAAIPYMEVPLFISELRKLGSVSALALEFAVLTAARTNEVINARWEEIDIKKGVWTIPKERMKAGREHRVPLSEAAVSIVNQLKDRNSAWVFPGLIHDKPLSNMAMLMLLKGMGREETVHGFRSAFTDWASEMTDFPGEVISMAKAHAIQSKTEAAYRRGDLFEKRRKLMDAWATHCAPRPSAVVLHLKNA